MNSPKVSVIVPVYNTELYLRECLESLLNQKYLNYEIILVNDGSTDNSLKILESYEKKYTNIRVISQSNSGLGMARNNAIKIAKGEYITFVDSDDWVSPDYLSELCENITDKSDIVVSKLLYFYNDNQIIKEKEFHLNYLDRMRAIKEILLDDTLKNYACGKLFKKTLFLENNIYFPIGMYYEDMATLIQLVGHANHIRLINSYNYYYRQSPDGISRKPSKKNIQDKLIALEMIKLYLIECDIFEKFINEYRDLCLFHLYNIQNRLINWSLEEMYSECLDEILQLINCQKLSFNTIFKSGISKSMKFELYLYKWNQGFKIYWNIKRFMAKVKGGIKYVLELLNIYSTFAVEK